MCWRNPLTPFLDRRRYNFTTNSVWISYIFGGTRWRSWLRHYATSRKVAGSIPDEAIGFLNWPNPSSRTMTLGSTQPLTEIITRNFPGFSVYYSHSDVQHHVPQNLLTLKVHYMFRPIWPSSGVNTFLIRKVLSSIVDIHAVTLRCACVLELVPCVLPCCVFCNKEKHNAPAALSLTIIMLTSFLNHAFKHQSFRPLIKGETPEAKVAGTWSLLLSLSSAAIWDLVRC
jgi:hypothetical protein